LAELTPIAAAEQFRLINDTQSARGQERIDRETETNTRANKAQQLQKLIAEETRHSRYTRGQQRTDFDASLSGQALARGSQQISDRIDNENRQDYLDARQIIDSRDANVRELLRERDDRLEKRESATQKAEIRQYLDLRLAEDRIRESRQIDLRLAENQIRLSQAPEGTNDGNHFPRGSIVDVLG